MWPRVLAEEEGREGRDGAESQRTERKARAGVQISFATAENGSLTPPVGATGRSRKAAPIPNSGARAAAIERPTNPRWASSAEPSGAPTAKAPYIAMPTQAITTPERSRPASEIPHARALVMTRLSPNPRRPRPRRSTARLAAGFGTAQEIAYVTPANAETESPRIAVPRGPRRSARVPAAWRVSSVTHDCAPMASPTRNVPKPSASCTRRGRTGSGRPIARNSTNTIAQSGTRIRHNTGGEVSAVGSSLMFGCIYICARIFLSIFGALAETYTVFGIPGHRRINLLQAAARTSQAQ